MESVRELRFKNRALFMTLSSLSQRQEKDLEDYTRFSGGEEITVYKKKQKKLHSINVYSLQNY